MPRPPRIVLFFALVSLGAGPLFSQAEAVRPATRVSFRTEQVGIQAIQDSTSRKDGSIREEQKESEVLSEQKQTLESELR